MKHHCTFCGLNRAGMEFRAKPAEQVLDMLESLSRRYGRMDFNAIDNIMAPEYTEQLFGRLAETEERHPAALRDPPVFQAGAARPHAREAGWCRCSPASRACRPTSSS